MLQSRFTLSAFMTIVALVTGGTVPPVTEAPREILGTVEGTFKVDHEGGAIYDIPLVVAPGTAGMTPQLNLTYNSHQGNGLVGVGWGLSGFSSVTRCAVRRQPPGGGPVTNYPVAYTTADRFCLDGQLLVAVDGPYGEDGTFYHTETESWTRVESHGRCGVGPCSFSAVLRNDERLELGSTDDSRIEAVPAATNQGTFPAGSVRVWALSERKDLNNNTISFKYSENTDTGEYVPRVVLYTGNSTPGAELSPQRAVHLTFSDRGAHQNTLYQGGARIAQSGRLLTRVDACLAEVPIVDCHDVSKREFSLVTSYVLDYDSSPTTFRRRLEKITRLGLDGQSRFPALRFTYQSPAKNEFSKPEPWTQDFTFNKGWEHLECQERRAADIDGDGTLDLIGFGYTATRYAFSTGAGFAPERHQEKMFSCIDGYNSIEKYPRQIADVNGDGRADIVGFGHTKLQVATSQGSSFSQPETWSQELTYGNGGWTEESSIRATADLNGDGRADVIGFGNSKVVFMYSEGDKFSAPTTIRNHFTPQAGYRTPKENPRMMADVNGDGREDIVGFKGGEVQVGISTGTGFDDPQTWTTRFRDSECSDSSWTYGRNPRYVTDVNGDGMADLVGFGNCHVLVAFSTGRSFTDPQPWTDKFTYNRGGWDNSRGTMRILSDVNGDGMADVIAFGHDNVYFGVSSGESFDTDYFKEIEGSFGYRSIRKNPRYPGDTTGVGLPALIGLGDSNVIVALPPGPAPDLLIGIENGIGGRISLTHGSIAGASATGFYSRRASERGYPYREYNAAIHVVTQHSDEDGRGNEYVYDYRYSGTLADVLERGFLGFRSMTVIDRQINADAAQPGLAAVSYFNQTYPLLDTLQRSEIRVVDGDRPVGETANEFDAVEVHPGVYDVRRRRETVKHYSLLSSNTYSTERRFEYDDFGNLRLKTERGNVGVTDDDLQVCTTYDNDPETWHIGFPLETTSAAACQLVGDGCRCEPVLTRSRWVYTKDQRWNLQARKDWVDTGGYWLGSVYEYDDYGNTTATNGAYWQYGEEHRFDQQSVTFDEIYHTFPTSYRNAYFSSAEAYDPRFGVVIRSTDANQVVMTHELDAFGRPVRTRGPSPGGDSVVLQELKHVLSPQGNYTELTELVGWEGKTASHRQFIDGLGRVYRNESPAGGGCTIAEETRYDALDRVSELSLPYYDDADGKSCAQKGSPEWTTRHYDAANRLQTTVLPTGVETRYDYDIVPLDGVMVDQVVQTDAAGTIEARSVTSYANAFASEIQRDYPPQGGASDNPFATFEYDRLERLRRVNAPGGDHTELELDSLGRTTTATSTSSGTWRYEYSLEGRLQKLTDAMRQTVVSTYDEIGRVKTETATDVDGNANQVTYVYDQNDPPAHAYGIGRLTRVEDPQEGLTHSYGYDPFGNGSRSRLTIDDMSYEIRLEYDPLARNTWLSYPDGAGQQKVYDVAGRLESVSFCPGTEACKAGQLQEYARYRDYSALGKPRLVSYLQGKAAESWFQYDLLGRIETATVKGSRPLIDQKYTWNKVNLITNIEDRLDAKRSRLFRLDKAGYLQQACFGNCETSVDYQYDKAGNLKRKGDVTFDYEGVRVTAGTRDGQNVFSAQYDDNGNMTWKRRREPGEEAVEWSFNFNAYDRLVEITRQQAGQTATVGRYLYDYQGHIVRKEDAQNRVTYYVSRNYDVTVLPDGGVVDTKYVDGAGGLVAAVSTSRDRLSSQIPSGSPRAWVMTDPGRSPWFPAILDVAPTADVLWGAVLGLVLLLAGLGLRRCGSTEYSRDNPRMGRLAWLVLVHFVVFSVVPGHSFADLVPGDNGPGVPVAGKVLFFHHDQVNSTSVVTDAAGNEQTRVSYFPYGQIYEQESHGPDEFRAKFSGREWSGETELYDFGSRYYDPFTGRFINADTRLVGSDGGSAVSLNRYAYAANNPISYVDPTGESAFGIFAFVAMMSVVNIAMPFAGPMAQAGAYFGASAVNHQANPAKWNYKSWKTYGGAVTGIAIAEVGEAISVVAPEALPEEAGAFASFMAGVLGGATDGFVQSASYSALGGSGFDEAMKQGGIGAGFGAGMAVLSAGVGRIAQRLGRNAIEAGAESAETGGVSGGRSGGSGEGSCPSSFVAGTLVHTEGGLRPIEEIEPGDLVYGYDLETGQASLFAVTATFSRLADSVVVIETTGGEVIHATPEHPFWVDGQGWVQAGALGEGDVLNEIDGHTATITLKTTETFSDIVYNFTVESSLPSSVPVETGLDHSYFVGKSGIWVHNAECTLSKKMREQLEGMSPNQRQWTEKQIADIELNRNAREDTEHYLQREQVWSRDWNPGDRQRGPWRLLFTNDNHIHGIYDTHQLRPYENPWKPGRVEPRPAGGGGGNRQPANVRVGPRPAGGGGGNRQPLRPGPGGQRFGPW